MNGRDPDALALRLARSAGLGAPMSLTALSGGRNNRLFHVILDGGIEVVLKCYHHDPRDQRDRLDAEWRFLSCLWDRNIRNVPQPLAASAADHTALYGFIAGRRAETANEDLVSQAADFVIAINNGVIEPDSVPPGSEACFSLADHLQVAAERVARLADLDTSAPCAEQAREFVNSRLGPAWVRVKSDVERQAAVAGIAFAKPIARDIASPSDFGFHNALIDEAGRASFIDFEYAGRDDPAKLVCDFFCQPDIPVPISFYPFFTARLKDKLPLQDEELWRCGVLLNVYRVKWACIVLNGFLHLGAMRRAFANAGEDVTAGAVRQLRRAEHQISLVTC